MLVLPVVLVMHVHKVVTHHQLVPLPMDVPHVVPVTMAAPPATRPIPVMVHVRPIIIVSQEQRHQRTFHVVLMLVRQRVVHQHHHAIVLLVTTMHKVVVAMHAPHVVSTRTRVREHRAVHRVHQTRTLMVLLQ